MPPICVPDRECSEDGATSRDHTDCSRYFVCHNGSNIPMECPEGQAFNAKQQWRTQEFFSGGGGGSTNSVEDRGQRTEDRGDGDLGAVAP